MRAKKSLGQNFLKSQNVVWAIINTADLKLSDTVLEVGPGKGILTEKLLEKVGKVIAVEKDSRLIEILKERFGKEIREGKLELLNKDILDYKPSVKNYKLVANIPYYITGEILQRFLSSDNQPEKMVLLVQKEVADRIVARGGKESILSISVKAYGEPKYIKKIGAGNFSPKPKVDSAILLIDNISKNFFTPLGGSTPKLGENPTWRFDLQVEEAGDKILGSNRYDVENTKNTKAAEENFFKLVKTGFAHKRKLLINNLKSFANPHLEALPPSYLGVQLPTVHPSSYPPSPPTFLHLEVEPPSGEGVLEKVFEGCGLDKKIRAENLPLKKWKCLYENL